MKSCLDCKYTEETIIEGCKKCVNEKSVYYGEIVDERDICKEVEFEKTN